MRTVLLPWLCALSLGLSSCAHGGDVLASAALNLALGVGASAASRASGGCYASCPVGTTCNTATGYCERLPCRDLCGPREHCETANGYERCVPQSPELEIQGANGEKRKLPLDPPPAEPPL